MFPVSTFGFKVDDLHGGDFFRDIGGRHVSRVINFFSGNACFFAGFQPEGVASSDNTFHFLVDGLVVIGDVILFS